LSSFRIKKALKLETLKMKSDERKRSMGKWVCTICGYVYDPALGDPDNGVDPGTAWEDVADDWLCPICGASKDDFEKEE
jgi:rubredoxin